MGTHAYTLCGQLFLQSMGGPIGMRFTASLANLAMKMWDDAFMRLAKRERVHIDLYLRYMDDCRAFLKAIKRGWIWTGDRLCFSE